LTPEPLFTHEGRKKIAEVAVWGNPPGQFFSRQAIQRRVEKILARVAKKISTDPHELSPHIQEREKS